MTAPLYQLCGDNIGKNVKRRYYRADQPGTRSLHYFHYYALKDRIDFSGLDEEPIECIQQDVKQVALSLLPSAEDDEALQKNICILISRVLYDNVPYFKQSFDGTIEWHIQHEFTREMSKKSELVKQAY